MNDTGNMEGDVSSTTQDVPVTEIRRMEVTVEVAETSDEEDMNMSTSSTGKQTPTITSPAKTQTTPVKESPLKIISQETPQPQIEEPQPSSATISPSKDELKTPKKNSAISICHTQAVTPKSQVKVFISPKSTIKIQGNTDDIPKISPNKIKILPSPGIVLKDSPVKKILTSQEKSMDVVKEKAASISEEPITTSTNLSPEKPSAEISTTEDLPVHTTSSKDKENGPQEKKENKDSAGQPPKVSNSTEEIKMEIDNLTSSQSVCDETSNDSQQSGIDKETGKNISRELMSLIKSAKESKIISECTQITSKIRKSRANDTSIGSANTSLDPEKLQTRRASDVSQKSSTSEKSDRQAKRSMRSHNPEFVSKNKQFLNAVTGKADTSSNNEPNEERSIQTASITPKKQKTTENKVKQVEEKGSSNLQRVNSNDSFCWRCHWAVEEIPSDKGHAPFYCNVCPRTYHHKCLSVSERTKLNENNLACPECNLILQAENSDTRSPAMKKINVAMLTELLNYAWQRMCEVNGVEPFLSSVDRTTFTEYDKYVVHPMDLKMMKENIEAGRYGSTEAFMSDAQWILHNSIIFNTPQSKLTAAARTILRTCRTEMVEVEACPECYLAAHARRPTWFTDVCSTPHMLLWAKLKGFPYWPAKAMSVNNSEQVDVRFFGAHDRAWVPAKDCFLYSEKDPNNFRTKRQDLISSQQEADQYIRNLSRKFGKFQFPQFRIQFSPTKMTEQLKMMIPGYQGEGPRLLIKDKSICNTPSPGPNKQTRPRSKSSKDSNNDVETSDVDVEDGVAEKKRKLTDKNDVQADNTSNKKAKSKQEGAKKRPRSELEEAVITVMDDVPSKRRRLASVEMVVLEKSTDSQKKPDDKKTKDKQEKDKAPTQPKEKDSLKDSKSPKPSTIKKSSTPKIVFKIAKKSPSIQKPKLRERTEKQKPETTDDKKATGDKKATDDKKSTDSKKNMDKNTTPTANKDKKKENEKSAVAKESAEANTSSKSTPTQKAKSVADRIVFDEDNTSLAVIAKKSFQDANNMSGLPTITNVVSLSTTPVQSTTTNKSTDATNVSGSTVYTHKRDNSKDAQKKPIGRLGVKAFARMPVEKETNAPVEVKCEPIEIDDPERQSEKIQMLNTFHLRPVNQSNLRDVRIHKVTAASPAPSSSRQPEHKAKAKKTFPQPKKADDRSGLNSMNSMVYIPIQPPITQAPVRPQGKVPQTANNTAIGSPPCLRTSTANSMVNTLTTPVMTVVSMPTSISSTTTTMANMNQMANLSQLATVNQVPGLSQISNLGQLSSVGPVPSSVHTVPLLTSLNGQWTFSLQPMMSVGGVDAAKAGSTEDKDEPQPTTKDDPSSSKPPPLPKELPSDQTSKLSPPKVTVRRRFRRLKPKDKAMVTIVCKYMREEMLKEEERYLGTQSIATVNKNYLVTKTATYLGVSKRSVYKILREKKGMDESSDQWDERELTEIRRQVKEFCNKNQESAESKSSCTSPLVNGVCDRPPGLVPLTTTVNAGRPTDNNTDMPRLLQRPSNPLDPNSVMGDVPAPSLAGPVTNLIVNNSIKLVEYFRQLLTESLVKTDDPAALVTTLKLQLEQIQWKHKQEIDELKHNHELMLSEVRLAMEKEKQFCITQAQKTFQTELDAAIKATKSKQWCAYCQKEAKFYCCWNTSYCDYPCQRSHWNLHFNDCTQNTTATEDSNTNTIPPTNKISDTVTKTPTNRGKLVPAPKVFRTTPGSQGKPIVVKIDDKIGNTVKCVNLNKSPQISSNSLHHKKHDDSANKKVSSSGGYIIVGGNNTTSPSVVIN